ncbi:ATP-binding protein [Pedobacter sp. MC2016-15]|uniref:ligand-binding sensor domain-containing protein n=1 Tax=Pedobacter sp. MC2016-15 TaxID=2994473 RepID=UPI002245F370|nr:two-component regulator propeller domain-containing protein [Pedobacter sp. MC2016-15]MCX2481331.1 ATP-binding protein [Pedobacter sp. MC2016-15]
MMNFFLRTVFLSLLMAARLYSCQGQPYYFKHYQVDDGLVHNSVTSILQDSKGLMWIGTRGGLNCFDGYTFKTIKNKGNKLGDIGNNVITGIREDRNGILWIGSGEGLFRYDPYREILTLIEKVPQTYIESLVIDADDNMWFLSEHSLYRYIQRQDKIEKLKISGNCVAIDHHRNIWVGSADGMASIYSPFNHALRTVRIVDESVSPKMRSINTLFPLDGDRMLVGCFTQGLKLHDVKSGRTRSISLSGRADSNIYVRNITAAGKQEFWISTESGIYIYDLAANTSNNIRKVAGDPYSIADNAVYTACKDNQGGMWIGTFFGGLNYYSKDNARFEKYLQLGKNSISGNAVREIRPDNKGNLWIGTEDAGLNKFNIQTGKFSHYTATGKKDDLSYPNIHGILAVGNDLFVGPFFHGMDIMDLRTGKVKTRFKFIGDKDDNKSDFVLCFYLTKDSTLLVGTIYNGAGLFAYNRKAKTFKRIKHIPYESYVLHILEDDKGNIWTGSMNQGAYYYNPKTGIKGNIRFGDQLSKHSTNDVSVRYILQDSDHHMWFATGGGGLIKLSPDFKTFKKFTTADGLPSNMIFCMLEDNSKHLWVSTLRGLVCLDLKTEKFKTYTKSNGLITDQFNYNSAYKDPNGKMYFGTVKGMIAFDPAAFSHQEPSPPTYITGFQINNKEIMPGDKSGPLAKSILYTDTITLKYDQSNFNIEFAALNYSSPQVTRYKYLMKGLDQQWTYLKSNRKAYFTDLSPGEYTFLVQAESNVGSWTGKQRSLFIRVLPPFWKSTAAYVVYLLISGLSLYLSVRYYHRYLERRNMNKLRLFEHEKEKEIYQAKIEFFTNIAHEIQTPLTLIVGPVELLISKTMEHPGIRKSLLMVEKNARRLAELTTQLLDFRKTESHQFGLSFVKTNMTALISEQVDIFRQQALKDGIELNLELPPTTVAAFVDREASIKISGNLISNAIKYAATTVTVSIAPFSIADDHFTIRFSNDGKGIPDEFAEKIFEPFFRLRGTNKPGTGIGLALARSLAELHNGSLRLVRNNSKITVFELRLPVHQRIEFKLSSWKKINNHDRQHINH